MITSNDRWVARHQRRYRRLLVLYPAGFRRQFGPDMLADFTDQLRAEHARRPRGAARRLWARILHDLFVSAPDQRWEDLMARTTAATILYSLLVYAFLAAVTRALTVTWLLLAGLAVIGVRTVANAPDPHTGRARLRTLGWVTVGVAAALMPLQWWNGIPEALAVIGLGLLVAARRFPRSAAS
jgi:hypothetical protein